MNQIINQTISEAQELFHIVMGMYEEYFNTLETCLNHVPESETEMISVIYREIQTAKEALAHDIAIFDQALQGDREEIHKIKEQLEINEIYKKLNSNAR